MTYLNFDDVHALLRKTFGSNTEVESHRVLNQQSGYWVLWMKLNQPSREILVKLALPHAAMSSEFERTAFLHQLIAEKTSVPISEILAVDTSCQHTPYRYLMSGYRAGQEWAKVAPLLDEAQRNAVFAQIGQAVAEIHSIVLSHFGEINSTQPLTYPEALIQRAQGRIASPHLRDIFLSVLDARRDLFSEIRTPRLCHDDLHHYNVLVDNPHGSWELASIIDFDKAWAGDPESDLARLDLWTNMMHPALRTAYEAIHPIDSSYGERRPVHQLFWCLEYAQPSQEHLNTTRLVCDELGIPPINAF